MSYNSDMQRNNDALRGILASVNELPEAQPVDDRFRRWDITTSGAVLYISGKARNIQAGYELAKKSIADGTALRKLEEVKRVSNSL